MNLTVNVFHTNFTTLSSPPLSPGGISINGDANLALSNTHTVAITDNCPADILVVSPGHHTYSMTVDNVYMDDITVDIIMVPIVNDILDPNYLRPYPAFFAFKDPCSFCSDVYNASSFTGDISWYVNNEYYKDGVKATTCFCAPGDYQIKVRNQTFDLVVPAPGCPPVRVPAWDLQFATIITGNTVKGVIDPIETYLALDTITNHIVVEYRISLELKVDSDIEPLVDESACCYFRDDVITITPTIVLNRPNADPALHSILFEVYDPDGVDITNGGVAFPLTVSNIQYQFTISKIGTYTVKATIEDSVCDLVYEKIIGVETCNFVFIKYTGCDAFQIQNRSISTDITYDITDVSEPDFLLSGFLLAGESKDFTFSFPSLYIFTAKYNRNGEEITEKYLLNAYCALERCFTDYIEEILCEPTKRCAPCPPESEISQMFLLYNTYFMKINKLFNTNSFFTALDNEGLSEITTLNQIMNRILDYCKRSGCIKSGAFSDARVQEGPYDMAGKGSNHSQCNCSPTKSGSYYNTAKPGYCSSCNGKV